MPPTRLVILGDPVAQSLSPRIHSAAIAAAGLAVEYTAQRVRAEDLEAAVQSLRDEGAGGNVTLPHKIAFRNLCSETSAVSARAGAVNTFWTRDGKLVGDNTDVGGFDALARTLLGGEGAGCRVALIGAGGSAAAVLAAVESWPGAEVRIFSRNSARAHTLAARFGDFARAVPAMEEALSGSNVVVNATPVGMRDDALALPPSDIASGAVVMDLVYKNGGTPLTRAAAAAGHVAVDGTAMLIEQAALAFERWFGFPPDKEVMRAALR